MSNQLESALARLGESKVQLSNLLCRIQRDGGHYEGEHGTEKAVEDADAIVAKLNADADELAEERATVAQMLELLMEAPELNMSNYTEEEVSALNNAVIEAVAIARAERKP